MKLLIEVQGNKPLNEYGDNHVIAYNKQKNSYYVTTAESLFSNQNSKIDNVEQKLKETKTRLLSLQGELVSFEQVIQNNINNFENHMEDRFREFLQTYQETNASLIRMVRELIEAKEEE